MTHFQWRAFQFFTDHLVKEEDSNKPHQLLQKLNVTCTCSGGGTIVLGDAEGYLNFVDRDFHISSFQAYAGAIHHAVQLKKSKTVITIGDDPAPTLKIFSLSNNSPTPTLLRTVPLSAYQSEKSAAVSVTTLAVLEDLSHISIGFANGAVLVLYGELLRKDRLPFSKAFAGNEMPVTGLGFRTSHGDSVLHMFVTTERSVVAYRSVIGDVAAADANFAANSTFTLTSNSNSNSTSNSNSNVALHSHSHSSSSSSFMSDSLANTSVSAGLQLELDSSTHHVSAHTKRGFGEWKTVELDQQGAVLGCVTMSRYNAELVLGRDEALYFYGPEGRGACFAFDSKKLKLQWYRNYLMVVSVAKNNPSYQVLNIYDLRNKFIAFSLSLQDIRHIVAEWGSVFVLKGDGTCYRLEEKDTQTKLDTLFRKNLFSVAIHLATSTKSDAHAIVDIYRRYGDHLYTKGDYDGAVAEYCKTIGCLEPSYVIRKFLDAQRIHNLTFYLQTLHEKNLASADHTTLLLNCYTKLQNVEKLKDFIRNPNLHFEVETAIRVCRQANFFEYALFMAQKHHEHDWYLKILIQDLCDYEKALKYIETLSFFEAEKNMKKYGKALVQHRPKQATNLLLTLCDQWSTKISHSTTTVVGSGAALNVDDLMSKSATAQVSAHPTEFIHTFVSQPNWLVWFLEQVLKRGLAKERGSLFALYNTLLEMYMRNGARVDAENAENAGVDAENAGVDAENAGVDAENGDAFSKALDLLRDPDADYDENHALVLAKAHGFHDGVMFLLERMQLYNEIVQYYMDIDDGTSVVAMCRRHGEKEPMLWVQALNFFSEKPEEEPCVEELSEVLATINKLELLPPLAVVTTLAAKPGATLELVRGFITEHLEKDAQKIAQDQAFIRTKTEETDRMNQEIEQLRSSAKVFQLTKCVACTSALDLPAVHFMCHSFHARCLGENERECPICAEQSRQSLQIRRGLRKNAGEHDVFFKALASRGGAGGGFEVVADYFGRSMFAKGDGD